MRKDDNDLRQKRERPAIITKYTLHSHINHNKETFAGGSETNTDSLDPNSPPLAKT
jgi:hypothetical protein